MAQATLTVGTLNRFVPQTQSSKGASDSVLKPAKAFSHFPSDPRQDYLAYEIARSRNYARLITLSRGVDSQEAAVAWEQLDELLSVQARHRRQRPHSSFEHYCAHNPDADECRLYDI